MSFGKVSVVIASRDEGDYLLDTVSCILENTRYPDFEVVVVDDGSIDGSGEKLSNVLGDAGPVSVMRVPGIGVAQARNLGAKHATGQVLVFMDAHSYTPPGWLAGLLEPLADPEVGMVGPAFANLSYLDGALGLGVVWCDASLEVEWLTQQSSDPYPVPILLGGCQVMRKVDFLRIGGYDAGMSRWGTEDQELCLRTWLMGQQALVQPRVVVHHLFRERQPYPVDAAQVLYNRLRMPLLHFNMDRVGRVIERHKDVPGFGESITLLMQSDVMKRRKQLEQQCQHDDDWFMEKFGCRV